MVLNPNNNTVTRPKPPKKHREKKTTNGDSKPKQHFPGLSDFVDDDDEDEYENEDEDSDGDDDGNPNEEVPISGSESGTSHVSYIWDHVIQKLPARNIGVVCNGAGGVLLMKLLTMKGIDTRKSMSTHSA